MATPTEEAQAGAAGGMRFFSQNPIHMLRDEVFGQPEERTLVFTYGSAEQVRAAKLEGMERRIQEKMADSKAAKGEDPKALRGTKAEVDLSTLTSSLTGDQSQFKSLVVPTETTPTGEDVKGSSRLILEGQRKDLLKTDAQQKSRGVNVVFGVNDDDPAALAPAPRRSTTSSVGPAKKKAPPPDPIQVQLQDGLTTFVPVKVQIQRPNALTSTAKLIDEARDMYHSTMRPSRAASAPPARQQSMAPGAAGAAVPGAGAAAGAPAPAGYQRGGAKKDDEHAEVYVRTVQVTEIDLFAQRKQQALKQLIDAHRRRQQAPQAEEPKGTPRATVAERDLARTKSGRGRSRKTGLEAEAAAAVAAEAAAARASTSGATDAGAAAKKLSGTGSSSSAAASSSQPPAAAQARPSVTGHSVSSISAAGGMPTSGQAGAGVSSPRGSQAASKPAVGSPRGSAQPPSSSGAPPAARTLQPSDTGSKASAVPSSLSAGQASSPDPVPRPRPQSATPARTFSRLHSAPPAAARGRSTAAHASPARSGGAVPKLSLSMGARSGTGSGSAGTGSASMSSFEMPNKFSPVPPDARRFIQARPGSALPSSKTNSRFRNGILSDLAYQGYAPSTQTVYERHLIQTAPPQDLQSRVLAMVAEQYIDRGDGSGGDGGGGGGGVHGMSAAEAQEMLEGSMRRAALEGGGSGGHGHGRPHSAPLRRARPPSAGVWAGRPDPSTILTNTIPRSATGLLYDPQVQKTPLDRWLPVEPGY